MKQAPSALRFAVVAVDVVVFVVLDKELCVLTLPAQSELYKGQACLPGGIIKQEETTDQAVLRVLKEKIGLSVTYHEQLATFSAVNRDKRNRVVSVAYSAFVRPDTALAYAGPGTFVPVKSIKSLAYDHADILESARRRLGGKVGYTTIAQYLLPRHFTLTELQDVYELAMKQTLDKRNFRKKILALAVLKETGRMQEGVKNRPAALYEFASQKLVELPLVI